jgi:glycerophosphoryl diester phosphodiesterase
MSTSGLGCADRSVGVTCGEGKGSDQDFCSHKWNVFRFYAVPAMSPRPLVLAHRGASHAERENTIAAFERAREQGADGVELDARRTSDDVLVVHHDPDVDGAGHMIGMTFTALRAAHPEIPTLEEALAACTGMLVNVEIKCLPWEPDPDTDDRAVVRAVVDEMRRHALEYVVSSFDLGAVDACRAIAPEFPTGWLTHGQPIAEAGARALRHGHGYLHPDRTSALAGVTEVGALHEQGLKLNVWTVDDPGDIRTLAAAAVDGIVTNVPDVALTALA